MSEMIDKMKEILEKHGVSSEGFLEPEEVNEEYVRDENAEVIDPLEEAFEKAMYSLEEIKVYAMYGRTAECEREAGEALATLKILKIKWEEQKAIMDALSRPMNEKQDTGYA
jgi:hypothetical protein